MSFSYGHGPVLTGVNFVAHRGTATAIMGESGSGKTTLLQLLAGLLTPTAGDIEVDGETFSGLREGQRNAVRLRKIGFVFQFGELLPELTLAENVQLPLLFLGWSRQRAAERAMASLDDMGIADLRDRQVDQVSGGQQQRAAIARALVHGPAVLLADEPTGSLDEENADSVLQLITSGVATSGRAVVLVTHSPDVAGYCGRTLRLSRGALNT